MAASAGPGGRGRPGSRHPAGPVFALWQLAGSFSLIGPDGALARAQWIWHAEQVVQLASETEIQRAFLGHPLLSQQALNLYYLSLHFVC